MQDLGNLESGAKEKLKDQIFKPQLNQFKMAKTGNLSWKKIPHVRYAISRIYTLFGLHLTSNLEMEPQMSTTSIFMEMQELEKQDLLIGYAEDRILFPIQVILQDGGKITWDKSGQFTTISMVNLTWILDILRRFATDIPSRSLTKGAALNTARQLIFSPQIFLLSNGTSECTGTLLNAEPVIYSGGEAIQLSVKRVKVNANW